MALYDSSTNLSIGQVPSEIADLSPELYQELLDIHNALDNLLTSSDENSFGLVERIKELEERVFKIEAEYLRYIPDYVDNSERLKNDIVRRGNVTSVALVDTTDLPDPQKSGEPFYIVADTPTFATLTNTKAVYSGMLLTVPEDKLYGVLAYRFWSVSISADYTYSIWIELLLPDGNTEITQVAEYAGNQTSLGWNTYYISLAAIDRGSTFTLVLRTESSSAENVVTGDWTAGGPSNAAPASAAWNTNLTGREVRVSIVDLDAGNRVTELTGIIAGSTLRFVDTAEPNRSVTYVTTAEPNTADPNFVSYAVTKTSEGPWGEPIVGVATTLTATTDVASSTDYVVQVGGTSTYENTQGLLSLTGSYDDAELTEDAYGIDMQLQEYDQSEDWDIIATVGDQSGAGSTVGGQAVQTGSLPPYRYVIIPEVQLNTNDTELTLSEISMVDAHHGTWRFGFDLRWFVGASGGSNHHITFRLYTVAEGVATYIGDYIREAKGVGEVDWTCKGRPFYYAGGFDTLRLTVEQVDGPNNPELTILEDSYMYVELKA